MEKNTMHSPLKLPTNHSGRIPKGDCLFHQGREVRGKLLVLEEDVNMQLMHSKQPVPIEESIASEGQEGEVGTCLKADLAVTGLPRFTREPTYPLSKRSLKPIKQLGIVLYKLITKTKEVVSVTGMLGVCLNKCSIFFRICMLQRWSKLCT